jgi:nucleotidyltransferase substrate binding protein (TIGR01987 family)
VSKIDTTYLNRSIKALEVAFQMFNDVSTKDDFMSDIYRSAVVKEFEIILELSGKLLKKALKNYFHSPKVFDKLYFKDVFREAGNRDLLSLEEVERWLKYRDNRNSTAHDYGENFANETLALIQQFIIDAQNLSKELERHDS